MLVSTGRGRRIHLASKIPIVHALVLSICHSRNYGVKQGNFMGEEKIHSLYLQREDTSSHGLYVYRTVPCMEIMACI